MVLAEDCWHRSLEPLMIKIRQELGDTPVYLSFDIDGIDASCCPGTGESVSSRNAILELLLQANIL